MLSLLLPLYLRTYVHTYLISDLAEADRRRQGQDRHVHTGADFISFDRNLQKNKTKSGSC
jgi:hypothetical protein